MAMMIIVSINDNKNIIIMKIIIIMMITNIIMTMILTISTILTMGVNPYVIPIVQGGGDE